MPVLEVFYMRASPPSYAVLALLKHTKTPYKATELDYFGGQQFTEEHAKRNPQKEVPVIQDGDYILCESVAILQYIADAYGKGLPDLYPSDPKRRGTINQRLAFNLCNLYPSVSMYTFGDVFGAPSTDQIKSKALRSLSVFETILKDQGTKFAAGEKFSIADIGLLQTAICMEAADFDFSPYPLIAKWYETCKTQGAMWEDFKAIRDDLHFFLKNPPNKDALAQLDKKRDASFQQK
ncbi:glutathione S-transferase 1-like isoform X1 [Neocloeon triangulifer]|uniref:glutathione S-transferase 1-like isoform X1 n=1 Tax=Neocloeon triangulifer TaxID=2078957 RepID=UPI00286EEBFC|nr:glutathione S-transferase 1-like isoform X1 [Neocloeon triangulifer]